MLTLLKREIEDNWVFFLAAVILAFACSLFIAWQLYYVKANDEESFVTLLMMNAICGMLIFCGLGAAQMYWDRTRKVSALLATLAVTRNKIFVARILAGALVVVVGFLPGVWTMTFVLKMVEPTTGVKYWQVYGFTPEIWIPFLLFCFGSYCVGMQGGWTSNKIMPTLGAMLLSFILFGVIIIKGFELDAYLILIPFIVFCLLRAWRVFSTTAL